jgi:acyl carrier protein
MDRSEIEQRVKKVVAEILKVEPDTVKPESTFAGDLGAESIQSIELVAGFEEEFGIELDEEAALAVKTVGGAIDHIAEVLAR